jgi:lipopolysaccharide cholinephosphotransferase
MITKDIDALCRKHGIEYYLLGGSALGAKRHQGFIPWDDDLDIVMTPKNYERFFAICRKELDQDKYYIQESFKDWSRDFSKIRLKGTILEEVGYAETDDDKKGIFVDVMRLDNAAYTKLGRMWQYFCGKLWSSYKLSREGYEGDGFIKKAALSVSKLLYIKPIERFFRHQIVKYNGKDDTPYFSDVTGRTRWKSAFIPREVYGKPVYVPFEDTMLPVQQDVHRYLEISFGDYMQLPPVEKRVGLHSSKVDFGKY